MTEYSWVASGYVLAAGALASFNPCGFAILPGFVAHYIGVDEEVVPAGWVRRAKRSFTLGVAATLALVLLFSAMGFLFLLAGQQVVRLFPWNQLAIGIVLVLLALRPLIAKKSLSLPLAHRALESSKVNPYSAFSFGFTYGVGSLGCTLTPFLIVAASAVATPGLIPALSQFVIFGLGMGGVVIAVSLGAGFFKNVAALKMRHILPHVAEMGAWLMLGAGAYLIIQWLRAVT